jgi:hypothetical protein
VEVAIAVGVVNPTGTKMYRLASNPEAAWLENLKSEPP